MAGFVVLSIAAVAGIVASDYREKIKEGIKLLNSAQEKENKIGSFVQSLKEIEVPLIATSSTLGESHRRKLLNLGY